MTDEQFIKAVECCLRQRERDCGECPLGGVIKCKDTLRLIVVDRYNRQKAEIEEFKKVIDNMADKLVQKDAEIEKSVKTIDGLIVGQKTLFEREKTAKSEAIKEFAERLKEFLLFDRKRERTISVVTEREIDNLVKEMVGAAEDSSESQEGGSE